MKHQIKHKLLIGLLSFSALVFVGCNSSVSDSNTQPPKEQITQPTTESTVDLFEGYTIIEVAGGNLSGHREPNVAVNIGFGDRDYWAFTNEHAQLVKVVADKIILQDEENEPVLSTGRYYSDEAKVPGVESKTLDEGHVIADSLGGVSNAYNITPQNSTLNRHGDQAYMEAAIRKAGGAENFKAIITYPDTETQIPSAYEYTYTINGKEIHDAYPNESPEKKSDKTSGSTSDKTTTKEPVIEANKEVSTQKGQVSITGLDKVKEIVTLKNETGKDLELKGWSILSVTGGQRFEFPAFTLKKGASVKVGDSDKNKDITFHWMEGKGVWNNSNSDPAELYDADGKLVARFED